MHGGNHFIDLTLLNINPKFLLHVDETAIKALDEDKKGSIHRVDYKGSF